VGIRYADPLKGKAMIDAILMTAAVLTTIGVWRAVYVLKDIARNLKGEYPQEHQEEMSSAEENLLHQSYGP
jgi:hypothetical protein